MAPHENHLDLPELERAAQGETLARHLQAHLSSCADCQSAAELIRALRSTRRESTAGHVCVSPAEIAGLAAEGVDESILARVADCAVCAEALRAAFALEQETEPAAQEIVKAGAPRRRSRALWLAAAAAGLLIAGGTAWTLLRTPALPELLARSYTASRPFDFRLPDAGYARVRQQRSGGSSVFDRPPELTEAVAALQQRVNQKSEEAKVRAWRGRVELMEGQYEAAIAALTPATGQTGEPAALIDLACAYALRGDEEGRKEDYARAAEVLLRLLRQGSTEPRVWFNLALVYQRLSLVDEGIDAWRKFLDLDHKSSWAAEARERLEELERHKKEKKSADVGMPPERVLAHSESGDEIEPYLEAFWSRWLVDQTHPTDPLRRFASAVAAYHGDQTLQYAVELPAKDSASLRLLASAIVANADGRYAAAVRDAQAAERTLPHAALRARASAEKVYALQRAGHINECIVNGEHFLRGPPEKSWQRIQVQIDLGSCFLMTGNWSEAARLLQAAALQAGECRYQLLRMRALGISNSLNASIGALGAVWAAGVEGLASYWQSSAPPNRLHQFTFDLARAATQAEWWDLARVLNEAHIRTAMRMSNPSMVALGLLQLSAMLEEAGQPDAAREAWAQALPFVDSITDPELRRNYDTEARVARARSLAARRPKDAIELLRQVDPTSISNVLLKRRLHLAYGHALLKSGNWAPAETQLEIFRQWLRVPASNRRIEELAAAEPAFRDLVQIELDQRRQPEEALRLWADARSVRTGMKGPDDGTLHLTLILLDDGVRGLLSDATGVRCFRPAGDALSLEAQVRDFVTACSDPFSGLERVRSTGSKLRTTLVGEVEARLNAAKEWTIDADSWLASVPFEALVMTDGQYAGVSHSIRYGTVSRAVQGPLTSVAIASVPVARGFEGNRLPILAAAARETDLVKGRFAQARALGPVIPPALLIAVAARSDVLHFVGHGWSNGGSGGLFLGDGSGPGRWTLSAAELDHAGLTRCKLVVLSACLSAAGESRGPLNASSLVRALLRTGVSNIVASRWNADSGAATLLFEHFYAALQRGANTAEALRVAMAAVGSRSEFLHPYYWAAFSVFS